MDTKRFIKNYNNLGFDRLALIFFVILSRIIVFTTTRGRQDLLIEMNEFKQQYYDRKKLISLGWKKWRQSMGGVLIVGTP